MNSPVSESPHCLEAYESLTYPTNMSEKVPNENGSTYPTGTELRDISARRGSGLDDQGGREFESP
jgi:hypothetical protein